MPDCFGALPSNVMGQIADYIDTTTWRIACRISPSWRLFPPSTFTFSGAPQLDTWSDAQVEDELVNLLSANSTESTRITHICGDRIYGGPTAHGNSTIRSLNRLLFKKPDIFINIVHLDLTGQVATVTQIANLFTFENRWSFDRLETVGLLLAGDTDWSRGRVRIVATPPRYLRFLKIRYVNSIFGDILEPILPLLQQVSYLKRFERCESPRKLPSFSRPISLETMISLENRVICGNDSNLFVFVNHTEHYKSEFQGFSGIPSRKKPRSEIHIPEIAFPQNIPDIVDNEILLTSHRVNSLTLRFSGCLDSLEYVADLLKLSILPGLAKYPHLGELTLPKEILAAWSVSKDSSETLAVLGSMFTFPSVHRLTLHEANFWDAADKLFPSFLRMFPNLEVLLIEREHYFAAYFVQLERILPSLRKLCLIHCKKTPYNSLNKNTSDHCEWLPMCQNLDVFYLYTKRRHCWHQERQDGGLLQNLAHNRSLRFVLIVVSTAKDEPQPTESDIAFVADSWGDRPWRCILLATYARRIVGAVRETDSSSSNARRNFKFIDVHCDYFNCLFPELFTVFRDTYDY